MERKQYFRKIVTFWPSGKHKQLSWQLKLGPGAKVKE